MKRKLLILSIFFFLGTFFVLNLVIEPAFDVFAEKIVLSDSSGKIKVLNSTFDFYDSIEEEDLFFDLNFLMFSNVAQAHTTLKKVGNRKLVATLEAKTMGFIGWLVDRHHKYISYMEVTDDNNLRSYKFERVVKNRSNIEKSVSFMDYKNHRHIWSVSKNGKIQKEGVSEIPLNVEYEDVLSTFYKFRFGYYGEIEKGKTYVVNTIPDKGISELTIKVMDGNDEVKDKDYLEFVMERPAEITYLVHVNVPKAMFGSKNGTIKIYFNSKLIPHFGNVEDALSLGDIIGKLRDGKD